MHALIGKKSQVVYGWGRTASLALKDAIANTFHDLHPVIKGEESVRTAFIGNASEVDFGAIERDEAHIKAIKWLGDNLIHLVIEKEEVA